MSSVAVLSLEGVLQQEVTSGPIQPGVMLYHGLKSVYRLAVVIDQPREKALIWLMQNGLREHAYTVLHEPTDPDDPAERRLVQLQRLRGRGVSIGLFVDRDPDTVAKAMSAGIPSLLFVHPAYARPEHRPDHSDAPTPWGNLADEMDRQALLRSGDTRRLVDTL